MDPKQIAITDQKNRNKTFQAGLARMKKERDEEAAAKKKEEDERQAKATHEQKKLALMQMNNIDEEEAQTRLEFQQRVESQESILKQMAEEIGEGYQDDARYQLRAKSLEEEKETEKKRVDDQQKELLEKIGDKVSGLGETFSKVVGETPAFMQGIGMALGLFLLGQFLTSDIFTNILFFITDTLVPAFKDFYEDIKNFDGTFFGPDGVFSLLIENFFLIIGIMAAFKPNLLLLAVKGIILSLKFLHGKLLGIAIYAKASAAVTKGLALLKAGFFAVGGAIKAAGLAVMGIVKGFLAALLLNPIGLIITAIVATIAGVVIYFDEIKNFINELGGIGNLFSVAVGAIKDGFARVGNFFIKLSNRLFGTEFEEFETDNFKKANEKRKLDAARYRIERQAAEKEKEEADKKKKHADEQMAAGNQVRDLENEAMGKKEQSAEDMLAGALDKLGALSGAQPSVITVDNSVRDNSSSSNTSVSNENIEDSDFAKGLGYMA